mgnify:CR=1 FL=1
MVNLYSSQLEGKQQKKEINMLELEHIKKAYDGVTILNDINLQINDGEIVSILGPSGCGKTTLLNLILGLVNADGGKIIFNGNDITDTPMEKRGFNIVFQDYALFPNLNVIKNIRYGLKNKPGISSEKEINDLIELLGLKEHLNKRIEQLSGGQKQRVAIARAMVNHPKLLLADEPTGALDSKSGKQVLELFESLNESGVTVVVITHDRKVAEQAKRIVHIIDGEITEEGQEAGNEKEKEN